MSEETETEIESESSFWDDFDDEDESTWELSESYKGFVDANEAGYDGTYADYLDSYGHDD